MGKTVSPFGQREADPAVIPPVAFVCHPYHRGGVTRWMVDAAAEWRRQGGDVWFVTPRPRAPFRNGRDRPTMVSLLEALPNEDRPTIVQPAVGSFYELGTNGFRASLFGKSIVSGVPEGVPLILSDDAAVWEGAEALRERNPCLGVLHSDDPAYYALARRFSASVPALVCVSRRIQRRLREMNVPLPETVAVIPCGIELRPLPPNSASDEPLRLIFVGRLDETQKRVSDLPRIAARLREYGKEFSLDVVGEGPAHADLLEAVGALRLIKATTLHGWLSADAIFALLSKADVLLLPSNFEGMPIVVMEALSAGCAVVASRVSGVEDLEQQNLSHDCLWVHEIGDIESAAQSVLAASAVHRAKRRRAARALAEAEFSQTKCVSRYVAVVGAIRARAALRPRVRGLSVTNVSALLSPVVAAGRLAKRQLFEWAESPRAESQDKRRP